MQSCCRALGKAPPCSGSSSPTRLPGTTASTRASRAPSNLSPTPRHLGPHPLRLPTTATRYKPDQQPAEPQAKQAATTDSTTSSSTTTLSSPTGPEAAAAGGAGTAAAAAEGAASAGTSSAGGAVQSAPVQLSAQDVMEDMCTMLGGITSKHFTGYAGQWRTWEVLPKQQQQQQHEDQQPHTDPTPGAVPTINSISDTTISSTTHPTSPSPSDTTNPPGSDSTTPTGSPTSSSPTSSSNPTAAEPPAAFSSSGGQHTIRLIDDGINVRLWRLQQQQQQQQAGGSIGLQKAEAVGPTTGAVVPPAAAAAAPAAAGVGGSTDSVGGCTVQQANFYHHPTKMAGPSTRFAQYLTGNTMSGRPDGYGLRVWGFNTGSDMINPDASSWLDGSGTPAECSMRVLTVPGQATTIINGALPSGFGPEHTPQFWVLEFIAKEPGSEVRRWSSMNWYDRGELVVNRSINEDRVQLAGEPDDIRIHPQDISFSNRREGLLPLDIDAWATQHTQATQGTATVFSFASVPGGPQGAQALTLTRTSGLPCTWSNPFDSLALTPVPAATATQPGGAGSTGADSSNSGSSQGQAGVVQQQQQAPQQNQSECPPVDVVVQCYPDWSYCRVPRSIREVVEGGSSSSSSSSSSTAVFEAGTVLRSGALVRWLLEYDTAGRRLIKSARFEAYPPAA